MHRRAKALAGVAALALIVGATGLAASAGDGLSLGAKPKQGTAPASPRRARRALGRARRRSRQRN